MKYRQNFQRLRIKIMCCDLSVQIQFEGIQDISSKPYELYTDIAAFLLALA